MLHKEKRELFAKVFSSVEGKQVIDWLCKKHYVFTSTYNKDGDMYETAIREGERRVMLSILRILKQKEKN